jgi:uncharacterized surface protein with fasciclin (FAS1) repeats
MAAAIALALGAATALAQQQPSSQQPRPSSQQPSSQQQQPSSQPGSQQPSSQQPRPSSQQPRPSSQQPSSQQQRSGEPAQVPPASRESSRSEQSSSSRAQSDQLGAQSQGAEAFDKLSAEHADLATFSKAVKTAGLADALTGSTEYTVFAPTDEAWEKSGKNADELMEPANREELVSLLRAHIVADDVDQQMASTISKAKTIDGGEVDIQSENGELMVGDAKAVDAESIEMDNLRIYPIDGVLAANVSASSALDDTSSSSRDAGSRSTQESTREPRNTTVTPDSSRTTTQTPGSNQPTQTPGSQTPGSSRSTQTPSSQTPGSQTPGSPASPPPSDRSPR